MIEFGDKEVLKKLIREQEIIQEAAQDATAFLVDECGVELKSNPKKFITELEGLMGDNFRVKEEWVDV